MLVLLPRSFLRRCMVCNDELIIRSLAEEAIHEIFLWRCGGLHENRDHFWLDRKTDSLCLIVRRCVHDLSVEASDFLRLISLDYVF